MSSSAEGKEEEASMDSLAKIFLKKKKKIMMNESNQSMNHTYHSFHSRMRMLQSFEYGKHPQSTYVLVNTVLAFVFIVYCMVNFVFGVTKLR